LLHLLDENVIMEKEKKKNEFLSLFSTPVVNTNIGREFTEDEINCISNISMRTIPLILMDKSEINSANRQSKDHYLFDTFAKELNDIKRICEYELKKYLELIEGVDTDIAGLRITQSWLNITKPGESHHNHSHPNSYLSGVLYIKCLPNDSIIFTNRSEGNYNNMQFSMKKITVWNAKSALVEVKKGDLILFPSWVLHQVDTNETENNERISLSFNTFPIGEMGYYDFATQLKL